MNNRNKTKEANHDEGKLVCIEIADATGHQTLMLSPQETEQFVSTQEGKWVFVDNRLIEAENLDNVDWNQAQSVRVMPGLVGGSNPPDLQTFFGLRVRSEEGKSTYHFVEREEDTHWSDGRSSRTQGFLHLFRESIDKNLKAIDLMESVINDSDGKIRIGRENILVFGDLASYAIPIQPVLDNFNNSFSANAISGLRPVEVHPRDKWIRNHKTACVQVESDLEIPSIDTLVSLLMGLKNDSVIFAQSNMSPLRNALIGLYGYGPSPISEQLCNYFKDEHGAILDDSNREFTIKGTDGWTWHFEYGDPEIHGFRISSIFRGNKRLHIEDSSSDVLYCINIEDVLNRCKTWPRALLDFNKNQFIGKCTFFRESIAKVWAPFRDELEANTDFDWEDEEDYFWD